LIVQDTTPEGCAAAKRLGLDLSAGGPKEAVADFLRDHPDFVADRSRERFLFTMHPGRIPQTRTVSVWSGAG